MPIQPHVMCEHCEAVFASSAERGDVIRCPHCGYEGKPVRVMRPTGFPDTDTFIRNWKKAKDSLQTE